MNWIQENLVNLGTMAGAGIACVVLMRAIPWAVKKYVGKALDDIFSRDTSDPIEKELRSKALLANMAYLEYVMPDRGKGAERKAYLVARFGEKAGPLIDELVSSLDDTLKQTIDKHRAP